MILRLSVASRWVPNQNAQDGSVGGKLQQGSASSSSNTDGAQSSLMSLGTWQLHRATDCRNQRLGGLDSGSAARLWLQSQQKDSFAMTAIRRVLVEEGPSFAQIRLRDEDVIEQVANLLRSGIWHVCEPVMPVYRVISSSEPAFIPVPRRGREPQSSTPPPEPPTPPTLAGNADQLAIAAVLTQASEDGVPFCEECAKAAARLAANQAKR